MKHLLALMALCVAFAAGAQHHTTVWPYNPDINADGNYGSTDLLGFLPLYGTEPMPSPQLCDYEGTEWEDLFFGVLDYSIILDSVYFSFTATDVHTYFQPGCPDAVTDTVTVSDHIMMTNTGNNNLMGPWSNGEQGYMSFYFNSEYNIYRVNLPMSEVVGVFAQDGFFGGAGSSSPKLIEFGLPLDVLTLDSTGVSYNDYTLSDWPYYEGDYTNGNNGPYDDTSFDGYMAFADTNWSLIPYFHFAE